MTGLNGLVKFHGVTMAVLCLGVVSLWGCGQQQQEKEQAQVEAPYAPEPTPQQTAPEEATPIEQSAQATLQEPVAEVTPVEPETEGPPQESKEEAAKAKAPEVTTVEVGLKDFSIDMPDTLNAGPVIIKVTNRGNGVHNFAIERQNVESKFDTNLEPGESRSLRIDLKPGEYRVYCPVGDHAERGMDMTLTVSAQ